MPLTPARLGLAIAFVCACNREVPQPPRPALHPAAMAGARVELGQVRRPTGETVFAVIAAAGTDLRALEALAREAASKARVAVAVRLIPLSQTRWASLRAAGQAKGDVDAEAVERSPGVIELHAHGPSGVELLRALGEVARRVGDASHGWVLDEGTGLVFPAARLADHLPGPVLDVRKLIVVHGVSGENEQPFLDTMGMERLGFPELYVPVTASGQLGEVAVLINAAAQELVTRGDLDAPGELHMDVARLGWLSQWQAGATGKATWRVRWAHEPDRGDDEFVLELDPPDGSGVEGLARLVAGCFGAPADPVVDIKADDPELLVAAEHARRDLAALRRHFARGVPPREQLGVKAPFPTRDGQVEWMWVDVVAWRGDTIEGTLDNDPKIVTTLRAGSRVEVSFAEIADYVHLRADGSKAGGYSVEVIARRLGLPVPR